MSDPIGMKTYPRRRTGLAGVAAAAVIAGIIALVQFFVLWCVERFYVRVYSIGSQEQIGTCDASSKSDLFRKHDRKIGPSKAISIR